MKNSSTSIFSAESEASPLPPIGSSEISSTSSARSIPSAKKSSKSTGREIPSSPISDLLPTPKSGSNSNWQWNGSRTKKSVPLSKRISSLEASPVSPFLKPDEEKERKTIAIYGRRCYESYESFIRGGSSVKMLAASLLGTEAWYSSKSTLIWKTKVTPFKRLLFQLAASTRPIEESEYGLWPTPVAHDDGKTPEAHLAMKARMKGGPRKTITSLAVKVQTIGRQLIPKTPSASDAEGGIMEIREGANGKYKLRDIVPHYTKMLPTPKSRDGRGVGQKARDNMDSLIEMGATKGQTGTKTGLKLQPAFVEWMMGFPAGWTELPDSKLLEMRSSRKSQKKS